MAIKTAKHAKLAKPVKLARRVPVIHSMNKTDIITVLQVRRAGRPLAELAKEIKAHTGIKVSVSQLSNVFAGRRIGKAVLAYLNVKRAATTYEEK